MSRPYNFSAGPAAMPESVLRQAAAEMLDWHGSGMSVMEMSHRGREFGQICTEAEDDLRALLGVNDDYAVMFMQGGATAENAIIPLNLIALKPEQAADYVLTGSWSRKSFKEAKRYGDIEVAAGAEHERRFGDVEQAPYTWVPPVAEWRVRPESSYVHFCSNETIDGVEFVEWPEAAELGVDDVPLVVDASSHFLSRPLPMERAGLVYAGAQKNAGPAGVTIVVARRDLLGHALPVCPSAFDYANVARESSRFNTPPSYAIYMAGLVFKWVREQGGLAAMASLNEAKARLLYDAIDASGFYRNRIEPSVRSRMNVPFTLADDALNDVFLKGATAAGLLALKGHKSVGGMRASIYNAMPLEGVRALVDYMQAFEKQYG
ncbi:MAG: 3-phosphoserine/phosphohydroxythreonine transaminase [Pigmentiphaga sp.]|nr:3-phosphoserine/phosphohydroxythreonine transaminase [Pigmentiphaga sp.]